MKYKTHTENLIYELYNQLNIFIPEQLDFQAIAIQLGIQVYYWPDQSQALFLKKRSYIFVNEQLTKQQLWQDFCHELGHVLLHTGHQGRMSPLYREYQENKANHFMYHACVPSFMLDEIEPYNLTVEYVQEQFNVEYDFALKRLEQYLSK
ncbi:ImmA/IrrE family metallo-endopeptidase [Lysinibacillus fusiformis]|uniref:ImmA/IrrE family metallo-endopeptidase n=1 Tax=Lysinibacillus fusiformis TaxID=28031 RepID=UPI0021BE3543|nr:ImmA/IrrE family metallo-endopeptidase [Lysinibacillus fusiformis]UXJ70795.1 ImmA/IrrE family metallo-endopeptidase [Lysinibacillus fusiformis]